MERQRLIVITGPTATGKTALGAALARLIGGEVVSADSMQIYTHMDIGTAKPTSSETLGVPHHMLGVVPPSERYSAARYVEDASRCVEGIAGRGRPPIVVGGTGLYIDSLISGRSFALRGDDSVRQSLESEYDRRGGEAMLARLADFDPESAARLHPGDKKRVVRAIEVYETTGITISEHDRQSKKLPPKYDAVKIALTFSDRQTLYDRIDSRVDKMLAGGLEEEVRRLLDMGLARDCTAMQAIGYKEMAAALRGELSVENAAELIKMESRRYAKRQLTWLRRDLSLKWINWENSPDIALGLAISTDYLQNDGYNMTVCTTDK